MFSHDELCSWRGELTAKQGKEWKCPRIHCSHDRGEVMEKCWIVRSEAGNIEQRCNGTHCLGRCSVGVFLASVVLSSSAHRDVFETEVWIGAREQCMKWKLGFGDRAVGNVGVVEVGGDLGERGSEVGKGR